MANGKLRKGITGLKTKIEEIEDNKEDACRKRKRPTSTETINLLTWNMQGGAFTFDLSEQVARVGGNTWKYLKLINDFCEGVDVFCLQEIGNIEQPISDPLYSREVNNYTYSVYYKYMVLEGGDQAPLPILDQPFSLHVYFTFWQRPTNGGGRVNNAIAIPANNGADPNPGNNDFILIPNTVFPQERLMLGMRIQGRWYFTFHGIAGGPVRDPLYAIRSVVDNIAIAAPWIIAGDYNVPPEPIINQLAGTTRTSTQAAAAVYSANQTTHNAKLESADTRLSNWYDYAVQDSDSNPITGNVINWERANRQVTIETNRPGSGGLQSQDFAMPTWERFGQNDWPWGLAPSDHLPVLFREQ